MKQRRHEHAGERIPNLAPMVDVIMVLLVFFMLGASFNLLREGALTTELDPRSGPGPGAAVEVFPAVKIALEAVDDGKGCNIYVMGEPVEGNSFTQLHRFLRGRVEAGADPQSPVVIGSQGKVRWHNVVAAMDAAVRAGFKNVQFSVKLGEHAR
jgi:biopolymer transport protein ExbD